MYIFQNPVIDIFKNYLAYKLPKNVLKNTKSMTPNSSSVRPEKFHPYEILTFWSG